MTEPQFYFYKRAGTLILIYCCPEKGSNIKNRIVYSTCKSSLADSIKNLGVSGDVKKYDVRESSEVTDAALSQHLNSGVATSFKPTPAMMRGEYRTGAGAGAGIARSGPTGGNFNRAGYNQPVRSGSAERAGAVPVMRNLPQGGLASFLNSQPGGPVRLPKGVVLPPKGAYC